MALCLIHQSSVKTAPRRPPETPVIVHRAYPEHIARCIIAVAKRRKREGMGVIVEKDYAEGDYLECRTNAEHGDQFPGDDA